MKMLLVGVLSVTLIGCSCPIAPQAMLDACASKPCFYRTAGSPPIELKPTPFKPNPTTTKVRSKNATKTAKASSVAAKAAKPELSSNKQRIRQRQSRVRDQNDPQFFCPASAARGERKEQCRNEYERSCIGSDLQTLRSYPRKSKGHGRKQNGGPGIGRIRGHE